MIEYLNGVPKGVCCIRTKDTKDSLKAKADDQLPGLESFDQCRYYSVFARADSAQRSCGKHLYGWLAVAEGLNKKRNCRFSLLTDASKSDCDTSTHVVIFVP